MNIDEFYENLKKANNKQKELVKIYVYLFGDTKLNLYSLFGKLLKIYTASDVFFSILECYDMESFNPTNPYGMLAYLCRDKIQKRSSTYTSKSLVPVLEDVAKINKNKPKAKGNPFED